MDKIKNIEHQSGCPYKSVDVINDFSVCPDRRCSLWCDLHNWFGYSPLELPPEEFKTYFTDIAHGGSGMYEKLVVLGARSIELFSYVYVNEHFDPTGIPYDLLNNRLLPEDLTSYIWVQKKIERIMSPKALYIFGKYYLSPVQSLQNRSACVQYIKACVGYGIQLKHQESMKIFEWMPSLVEHLYWSERLELTDVHENSDLILDLQNYFSYEHNKIIPRIQQLLDDPFNQQTAASEGQQIIEYFVYEYFYGLAEELNVAEVNKENWIESKVKELLESLAFRLFAGCWMNLYAFFTVASNDVALPDSTVYATFLKAIIANCFAISRKDTGYMWMRAFVHRLRQIQLMICARYLESVSQKELVNELEYSRESDYYRWSVLSQLLQKNKFYGWVMNAQHVEVLPEEKEENKNGISSIAKETKKEEKEEKVDEEKNLISRKNYASNSREACFQTLGLCNDFCSLLKTNLNPLPAPAIIHQKPRYTCFQAPRSTENTFEYFDVNKTFRAQNISRKPHVFRRNPLRVNKNKNCDLWPTKLHLPDGTELWRPPGAIFVKHRPLLNDIKKKRISSQKYRLNVQLPFDNDVSHGLEKYVLCDKKKNPLVHVEIETKQKEKADMPCILTTVHPNKDAKPVELEFEFTQNTKDKNVKTKVKSENSKEFVVERCIEINGTSTSESLSQKDQIEIKQKNNKTSQKNEKEKPSYNRDSNLLNSELLNDSYNQEQNPVYEMYFSDKGSKRYSHHTEKYPNDYQDKYLRNGQNNQQNYYDYPEPVQYDYNEPDYYGEDQPNHNQINYSENSNYDNANYNQAYDNDVNYNDAKYNDADYNDANYNDANYNDANYNDANYNDANYNDANYNDANYNDANYNDANYNDAYYNDANYNGADYNNTNYNDANYNDANYNDASYNDTNYDDANYNDANYNDANYNDATYNDANYNDATYNDANYNDATYNDANYNDANYNDANYNDANYNDANYNDANYNNANYNDANYNDANYNDANYNDANYNDANYDDANYNAAIYNDSSYHEANYNDANYDDANYNDANYDDANYDDANYNDANYNDANYDTNKYRCDTHNNVKYNESEYKKNKYNYNHNNHPIQIKGDKKNADRNMVKKKINNQYDYVYKYPQNNRVENLDHRQNNDVYPDLDTENYLNQGGKRVAENLPSKEDKYYYSKASSYLKELPVPYYSDKESEISSENVNNFKNHNEKSTNNNFDYGKTQREQQLTQPSYKELCHTHNNDEIKPKQFTNLYNKTETSKIPHLMKPSYKKNYFFKQPELLHKVVCNISHENLQRKFPNKVKAPYKQESFKYSGRLEGKYISKYNNVSTKFNPLLKNTKNRGMFFVPVKKSCLHDLDTMRRNEIVKSANYHSSNYTKAANINHGRQNKSLSNKMYLNGTIKKQFCKTIDNSKNGLSNKKLYFPVKDTSKYKKNCYIDKKQFRQYKSSLIPYHIVDLPKKSYVNVQQPAYKLDIVNKTDRPWVYMEQRSISYENPQKYFPHKQNDVCPLIESEYSNSSNNNDAPPNHEKNSNNHSATYSDKQTVDHSVNYDTREQINTNISPENSFYSHGKSDHTENNISLNLPYYSEDNNSQNFAGTTETLSINENSHKSTTCIPKKERSNSDSAKENTHQISSQNSNSIKRPYNFSEIDITRESINNNQHTKYSHKKNIQLGSNFLGDLQSKIEIKNTNLMIPPLRPLFM